MSISEDLHVAAVRRWNNLFHWGALKPELKMTHQTLLCSTGGTLRQTGSAREREKTKFTNEKLYLRIPTSVDAIIVTMQNGKYNAVLLTKIVLRDLTMKSHYICRERTVQ